MNITPLRIPSRLPRFFFSPPGEISRDGCWCCIHECYLYIGTSWWNLLWVFLTEFRHDRHLVG